jgi:hypothetical protein
MAHGGQDGENDHHHSDALNDRWGGACWWTARTTKVSTWVRAGGRHARPCSRKQAALEDPTREARQPGEPWPCRLGPAEICPALARRWRRTTSLTATTAAIARRIARQPGRKPVVMSVEKLMVLPRVAARRCHRRRPRLVRNGLSKQFLQK